LIGKQEENLSLGDLNEND